MRGVGVCEREGGGVRGGVCVCVARFWLEFVVGMCVRHLLQANVFGLFVQHLF